MKRLTLFIGVIIILGLFAARLWAAAGAVDPAWGVGGLATAGFAGVYASASAGVLGPGGDLLVAGYVENNASGGDFGLVRFRPNGALDTTFGDGGRVTTDFANRVDQAWAVVRTPAGGYRVTGETCEGDFSRCVLAVAAYRADGRLDPAFGNGGRVTTDPGSGGALGWPRRAVWQSSGKLLTGGGLVRTAPDGSVLDVDILLVRYNPDGTRDTGFGDAGIAATNIPGTAAYPLSLRSLPGDQTLVVGALGTPVDPFTFYPEAAFLARFNSDGSLDTSFAGSGFVSWTDGVPVEALDLVVEPGGAIAVLGYRQTPSGRYDCTIRRFSPAGVADASFGQGGWAVIDSGRDDICYSIETLPDGQFVVVGTTAPGTTARGTTVRGTTAPGTTARGTTVRGTTARGTTARGTTVRGTTAPVTRDRLREASPNIRRQVSALARSTATVDMLVARLNPDGSPDTSFGVNGLVVHDIDGGYNPGWDGLPQPDGRILVIGDVGRDGQSDIAVVRFLSGDETFQAYLPFARR